MKKEESLKQNVWKILGCCTCWGIGYAGMWGMKWIIADLTLHTGTIKDAAWSIIGRTEAIGGRSRVNGGRYVISLNLQEYQWKPYLVIAAGLALLSLVIAVIAIKSLSVRRVMAEVIPYAIIFCIPFAWIVVVQHHSALHARFTFRIISVAVAAFTCMGISLADAVREQRRGKNLRELKKQDVA